MKKKIVYVEPDDMIEIRVCNPVFDMGANKTAWEESMNPTSHLIIIDGMGGIVVSHIATTVRAWMPNGLHRYMEISK
jgi:hypothetical protein